MYYCIYCKQYHSQSTALKILNTGFRTESAMQKNIPLGYCHKELQQQEQYAKKK
ncbi:DUF3973 domain-containing protein [Ammoniphilus sp. 3BR4]|uniref:DUF3973 domain-containing protein n=1 Tax=Ammoniphilus sp. 3BR4 TaxID=3158265 RepID=UPI003467EAC6